MIFYDYFIKYTIRLYCSFLLSNKLQGYDVENRLNKISLFYAVLLSFFNACFKYIFNYNFFAILIISLYGVIISYHIKCNFIKNSLMILLNYIFCLIIYFIIGLLFVSLVSCFIFNNDYPTFIDYRIIDIIFILIIKSVVHLRKLKNGLTFLNNDNFKKYKNFIIFISLFILIFSVLFWYITVYHIKLKILKNFVFFTFLSLCIFIIYWIKREMKNYYAMRANEKTIENLTNKVKDQEYEIERLIKVSKISHKTNHQIDVLKSKLIGRGCDDILAELKTIADSYHSSVELINKKKLLQSTKVTEVDEVLEHILNECAKNKIDFVIKINGSINYMVKNIVSIENLVTILSDHLKNAIISIGYSKMKFRSITINIGEIGDYYGVAIHDTGTPFKINTLVSLGLKAVTTHKKDGGTGIGFLTTFGTIKKYKASLIINERKQEEYNYTKCITILFDEKNSFRINSYRAKLINSKKKQKITVTNKKIF